MKKKAFKAAFPYTIPIGIGFLFLGMSYGFMMQSKGFSVWYPFFMSMFIFAGSMEFVTANLLLSALLLLLHPQNKKSAASAINNKCSRNLLTKIHLQTK